jgi:hypothetical protein
MANVNDVHDQCDFRGAHSDLDDRVTPAFHDDFFDQ